MHLNIIGRWLTGHGLWGYGLWGYGLWGYSLRDCKMLIGAEIALGETQVGWDSVLVRWEH